MSKQGVGTLESVTSGCCTAVPFDLRCESIKKAAQYYNIYCYHIQQITDELLAAKKSLTLQKPLHQMALYKELQYQCYQ